MYIIYQFVCAYLYVVVSLWMGDGVNDRERSQGLF